MRREIRKNKHRPAKKKKLAEHCCFVAVDKQVNACAMREMFKIT
jgi:hypothetical protein